MLWVNGEIQGAIFSQQWQTGKYLGNGRRSAPASSVSAIAVEFPLSFLDALSVSTEPYVHPLKLFPAGC